MTAKKKPNPRMTRKPAAKDLRRFAEVLHKTDDAILAYRAMRPNGRIEVAERQAPRIAALPEVAVMVAELKKAPDGLTDDERMAHHALALADDAELSPRERLEAMKTYDRLRKSIGVQKDSRATGGFCPELRAFLSDQGISVETL